MQERESKGVKAMKIIIRDNQAGFVMKNGVFLKMIGTGVYYFPRILGYYVYVEEMQGEVEFEHVPYQVLQKDENFQASTIHIQIADGFLGFLYKNGNLNGIADKKEYTFWNVYDKYFVKQVSMQEPKIGEGVTRQMLSVVPMKYYKTAAIGEGEVGLLYYNNILQEQLTKGIYYFWNYSNEVSIKIFDMKQKTMDIVGQEILTKDKIGIRMNVTCMYKIKDAVEFVQKIADLKGQMYPCVQLAIREMTGNYKLDEILEMKDAISKEIYEKLKEQEDLFCVEFISAGIKDIILPGEIQNIMNSVLVAEKTAQANVIARREEVASTRSLLNTAKLMDENKTLYKLKELEYLEKICDRVGEISVNGNGGLVEQLGKLIS